MLTPTFRVSRRLKQQQFPSAEPVRGDDWSREGEEQLAVLLGIDRLTLVQELGGPWQALEQSSTAANAPQFLGRAGPSVLIEFDDEADEIRVRQAAGEWLDPGTIHWSAQEPQSSLPLRALALDELARVIDLAAQAKASTLVTCRFCGDLVAPEFAFGYESCSGCASSYFGVLF